MLLLVNLLHVHNAVAKILTNILVVIINYFFSKWFIFNRDAKQPPEKTAEKNRRRLLLGRLNLFQPHSWKTGVLGYGPAGFSAALQRMFPIYGIVYMS